MPQFIPVDADPFASAAPSLTIQGPGNAPTAAAPQFVPVDNDPFAGAAPDSFDPEGTGPANYASQGDPNATTPAQKLANLPGATVAALDGFANSVPFTDRMAAAAAAATGLGGKFGDYSGNLAQLHSEEGSAMAAHPAAATAGILAGGAALPAGAVGEVATGVSLGGKAVRGAIAGGLIGGLQGASSSQNLTDVGQTAKDAGIGAGIGAGVGGVIPPVASGVGWAARKLAGDTVQAVPGVNNAARDVVLGAIDKDGAANVQRNADLYGDSAMLFDYGTGLRGVAEGLATKDGPAASTIGDALGYRQAGTNARVQQGLNENFGQAQDPTAVTQSIQDTQQAATAPLFQQAYQQGQLWNPELDALSQRPAVASALQDAATTAANQGKPLPTVTLDQAGNPVASDAAMQAYEAGTRPAVTGAMAEMLGVDPNAGPLSLENTLVAQRKAASDPLYAAYRQMSVPMTPDLAEVLNRPSVKAAIPSAERKAADQGRTIFATRPSGFDADPVGSGTPADMPNYPDPVPLDDTAAPTRPGPVGVPRPQDLHGFIRSAGGMQDPGGDLASMGLGNLIAKPGQGLGPDAMRQAAAQSGYLGADVDHAMAGTDVNDLLNAIGSDSPVHSVYDQDALHAWNQRDAAMQAYQQGGAGNTSSTMGVRPPAAPGSPFGGPDVPTSGPATRAPQLTPEGLDYLKRALGDKIDTAQSAGNRDDARIYGGLKDELLGAIENHPDTQIAQAYSAARNAYAGPSREIDALKAGQEALGNNVTREQMARDFGALGTDGERQQYRAGLFNAMREQLGQKSDTANFVNTIAGNQALRDKFALVAPHQGALDNFNRVLDRARQTFTEAQRPTVEGWHGALQSLDAKAAGGDPGVTAARNALAGELGQLQPFARARGIEQDYAGLKDAIGYGRKSLAGGDDPVWPGAYADRFGAMTPAEQAANRVGQRSVMEEAVGTKPNDQLAMKQIFQTGNTPGYTAPGVSPGQPDLSGWNAQKLETSFGQKPVANMQELLNANDAFNSTFNGVAQNSRTARRSAMMDALSDAEWKPKDIMDAGSDHATGLGMIKQAGAKVVNAVGHAFQNAPSMAARDADLARVGTMTGMERQVMLGNLLEQLPAYQGREAADQATRNRAMLVSALTAGAATPVAMDPKVRAQLLAKALNAPSPDQR